MINEQVTNDNYCILLQIYFTSKFLSKISNIQNNSNLLINSKESYKYEMNISIAQKLNYLIKLQKIGKPIKPLINGRKARNYKIFK